MQKIRSLLGEFLNSNDCKEAAQCIQDLRTEAYHADVVTKALDVVLDKTEKDRNLINTLFAYLAKEGVLSREHFDAGFKDVLEFLEDMIIDIPLIVQHLALILAPLFSASHMSIAYLGSKATEHLKSSGKRKELALLVFKSIKAEKSADELITLITDAKLNLGTLSNKNNTKYLKGQDLDELELV